MATIITAGNATNGLTLTPDNTGILQLKTGTGAGTTAITADASQNVTVAGTLQAAGVATNMYPLVSGASVSASGTSVDFTSIPSWVKRITVMFSGVSVSGTSSVLIQIGDAGGVENTGYIAWSAIANSSSAASATGSTAGFIICTINAAADTLHGGVQIAQVNGASWVEFGSVGRDGAVDGVTMSGGSKTLSDTLDRVRITTVNGTDTFDAGTINILYE